MNLKQRISKKNTGEKVTLKTFPELWVVPKKFSVIQEDEINTLQKKVVNENPQIIKIASKIQNKDNEFDEKSFNTFLNNANDEELKAYLAMTGSNVDYSRKMLLFGIGKNNLCDDEEKNVKDAESLNEEIVEIIFQDKDLTAELLKIVNDFNNVNLMKQTSETVSPGV